MLQAGAWTIPRLHARAAAAVAGAMMLNDAGGGAAGRDDDDAQGDDAPPASWDERLDARLPGYAELHCSSAFSFGCGASQPHELVRRAWDLGYHALALTDEASVAGVVRAHAALAELRGWAGRLQDRDGRPRLRPLRLLYGAAFDLDASALVVGEDGKVLSAKHFVFFNNQADPDGAVTHLGDNRTGVGAGDDEVIKVELTRFPATAKKVVFVVTIYEADTRGQNFGQVNNAYIRGVNEDTQAELVRYDLSEDFSIETAMIFGELYRHNDEWKFKAIGQGYAGGLNAVVQDFGVQFG